MRNIIPMELTDLNSSIDMAVRPTYGGLPKYGVASGDMASFITNINYPLKKLEADITAQQDLHGYSHPWAGGAGKNILPNTLVSGTLDGITYTANSNGSVTVSGTATNVSLKVIATMTLGAGTYKVNGGIANASISVRQDSASGTQIASSTGDDVSFTLSASSTIVTCIRVGNGVTASGTVYPMIRLSSVSDATYEPYSNICPIDGFDEVVVNVRGKNLYIGSPSFDGYVNRNAYTLASETYNGHEVIQRSSAWNGAYKEVPVLAGKTYTFSTMVKVNPSANVSIYNASNDRLLLQSVPANTWTRIQTTFTASEDKLEHLRVELGTSNTTIYLSEYQLELGSTATEYEPYNGNTYTTAVNVWDEEWESGLYNVSTGQKVDNGNYIRSKNYISVLPNTTYYLKTSRAENYVVCFDSSKNFISTITKASSGTFTTPANAYYVGLDLLGTTYNHDISINYPSNNTQYIPYKGSTATQNYMDTFGHGVYGGTLDVTTGVLTITWIRQKFSELQGLGYNSGYFYAIPANANAKKIGENNIFSSIYKNGITGAVADMPDSSIKGTTTNGNIFFKDSRFTTTSALLAEVGNETVCFELSTPQTVQLSPQEVESVCGQNHIWANSGQVYVEYHYVEDFEE